MPLDIDSAVVSEYLDNAQLHASASNDWAEGYWIGRAVQHAHQNAIDYDWLSEQFDARGLDSAVLQVPKPGEQQPELN